MDKCVNIQLTKNKSLEIQISLFGDICVDTNIFDIWFGWSLKGDHAGIKFMLEVYKSLYFAIQVYDHRHWDWENDKWEE